MYKLCLVLKKKWNLQYGESKTSGDSLAGLTGELDAEFGVRFLDVTKTKIIYKKINK